MPTSTQKGFEDRLEKHRNTAKNVAKIGIFSDTAINTAYIYQAMSTGDAVLSPILGSLVFFIFWFTVISWMTNFGIDLLSCAEEEKKKRVLPLWSVFMVSVTAVSVYMGANFLGGAVAKDDYLANKTQQAFSVAHQVLQAQARITQLKSLFETANGQASLMLRSERQGGGVSNKSGPGPVTTLLEGLVNTSVKSSKQIIVANGKAQPIIRELEESEGEINRLNRRDDLSHGEKNRQLQDKLTDFNSNVSNLQKLLPISTLETAIDSFGRDFDSVVDPVSSERITSVFHPISTRLARELGSIKDASSLQIPPLKELSDYQLLSRSDKARPLIVIALLLACMPLAISFCIYLIAPVHRGAMDNILA